MSEEEPIALEFWEAEAKAYAEETAQYAEFVRLHGNLLKERELRRERRTLGTRHDPYGQTLTHARVGELDVTLVECGLAGTYLVVAPYAYVQSGKATIVRLGSLHLGGVARLEAEGGKASEQRWWELTDVPVQMMEAHFNHLEEQRYEAHLAERAAGWSAEP